MTGLIIAMTILAVGVAIALARPLLHREKTPTERAEYDLTVFRDQLAEIERDAAEGLLNDEEAEAARLEVQRRMLAADAELQQAAETAPKESKPQTSVAILVSLGVPVAAAFLYLTLGSPDQPDQPFAERNLPAEAETQVAQQQDPAQAAKMEAMVGRLAEKLLSDPDDVEGWLLLGRSYIAMERIDDAMNAFKRARKIAPGEPEVDLAYAEALILTSKMKVTEDAAAIFRAVHEKEPFEPKSRYYLGLQKAQAGDVKGALQDWADLIAISSEDAPWVPIVRQQVVRAADELNVDPAGIEPSDAARELIASRPPILRTETPIMPSPSEATGQTAPMAQPAPGPSREQMEAAQDMTPEERAAMIRGMVERLADRMKENPDDIAGWRRLERAYRVLGDTAKADEAAAQIKRLTP